MNNEIEILQKIFGDKDFKLLDEELDIPNYSFTISFDEIRILKFIKENDSTYVVYINNLDIPYKLSNFDEMFFSNLNKIYY